MTLQRWLQALRGRVRARRALGWTVWTTLAWSGAAFLLLIAARLVLLGWERRAAWWGLGIAGVAGFAFGATRRLPLVLVARAADRDLAGGDRIATAAELHAGRTYGALDERQVAEAARWATTTPMRKAAPLRVPRRPTVGALGLVAAVGLLSFLPNPMDEVIERRRAEQELVRAAAEAIERDAEAMEHAERLDPAERKRLADQLRRLALEMREAPSLRRALEALERAESRLLAEQSGAHLAVKALTAGFERSLVTQPLVRGAGDTVPEQLRALASPSSSSGSELRRAGDRLADLARSLRGADPALAAAMEAAAKSLGSGRGDPAALQRAARAWATSQGRIVAGDTRAAASARLGALRRGLAAATAGQGRGRGLGGNPVGRGGGQGGTGTQAGRGGAAGTSAPFGPPATGGASQPKGSGFNPSNTKGAPVYDPVFGDRVADRLHVSGRRTNGREQIVGTQVGRGGKGPVLVPYEYVYPQWSARAARAVEVLSVPAPLRALVRDYFAALAPEDGP